MKLDDIQVGEVLTHQKLDVLEARLAELVALEPIQGYELIELDWITRVLEASIKGTVQRNKTGLRLIIGGKS